ncbi:MAG: hypothetical protein AAGI38_15990 [Bacteroidota bacterium]
MQIVAFLIIFLLIITWLVISSSEPREVLEDTSSNQSVEVNSSGRPEFIYKFKKNIRSTPIEINSPIIRVLYGQVNHPSGMLTFQGYDLCDTAVMIELANGVWVNWIWVEQADGPVFTFSDKKPNKVFEDEWAEIKEMNNSANWQPFINQELERVELVKKEFGNGQQFLSDLILYFQNGTVSICGIDEPDPYERKLEELPFLIDWTAVIFNERILETNKRGFYS